MSSLMLLDKLDSQKHELLLEMEGWSFDRLTRRPSVDGWSAVEILDHLVRTEVEILAAAGRGLLKPHRIGPTDTLRTRFLEAIFRSDRKVKVPLTASRVLPGSNLELSEIARRWDDGRRDLLDVLKTVPEAKLEKGIFKHPVGGWMGMPEILNFFSVHMVHHNYQLARL